MDLNTKKLLTEIVLEVFKEQTAPDSGSDYDKAMNKLLQSIGRKSSSKETKGKKTGQRGKDFKTRKRKVLRQKNKNPKKVPKIDKPQELPSFPGPSEWKQVVSINPGRKFSLGDEDFELVSGRAKPDEEGKIIYQTWFLKDAKEKSRITYIVFEHDADPGVLASIKDKNQSAVIVQKPKPKEEKITWKGKTTIQATPVAAVDAIRIKCSDEHCVPGGTAIAGSDSVKSDK